MIDKVGLHQQVPFYGSIQGTCPRSPVEWSTTLQTLDERSCVSSFVNCVCCLPRSFVNMCCVVITKITCGYINLTGYDPLEVIAAARELQTAWSGKGSNEEKQAAWTAFCARTPGIEAEVEKLYLESQMRAALPNANDPKAVAAWKSSHESGARDTWRSVIADYDMKVPDRILGFMHSKIEES